jgi:AraC-like DNA-binding protein
MMESAISRNVPRTIVLPPPGRPNWIAKRALPLLYLSWGARDFGKHPIPATSHTGWVYFLLERGSAKISSSRKDIAISKGDFCIIHPDFINGWVKENARKCFVRTWVWSKAPQFEALGCQKDQITIIPLEDWQLIEMRRIHEICRREVTVSDDYTCHILNALRDQVDALLCRALTTGSRNVSDAPWKAEIALNWLRENIDVSAPMVGLCDYLKISSATLHRLLVAHYGKGVRQLLLEMRVNHAQQLKKAGWMQKEAALRLGYSHPSDLSRAIKRATKPRKAKVK